jgi:3D (Asp-Asp-Asp) domain-containing protein
VFRRLLCITAIWVLILIFGSAPTTVESLAQTRTEPDTIELELEAVPLAEEVVRPRLPINVMMAMVQQMSDQYSVLVEEPEPIIETIVVEETIEVLNSLTYRGRFMLTGYCPCRRCCGRWAAPPDEKVGALGTGVYQGATVAADPTVLPYGTVIYIPGYGVRVVVDTGVTGYAIDIYFICHYEAWDVGRQRNVPVYIVNN